MKNKIEIILWKMYFMELPVSPVAKVSPCSARGLDLILVRELAKLPHACLAKHKMEAMWQQTQ